MEQKIDIRLDKLVLRNYKGFYTGEDEKGVEITFDKNLTVFIGDNGAGKSTVLDAIALSLMKLRSEITNTGEGGGYGFPLDSKGRKNKAVNNEVEEAFIDSFFELSPSDIYDVIYKKGLGEGLYEKEIKRVPKIGFSIYMEKEKSPSDISVNKWFNHTNEDEDEDEDDKTLSLFLRDNVYDSFANKTLNNLPLLAYYGANTINTETNGELEEVDTSIFDAYRDALDANKFSFRQFFVWYDDQQRKDILLKSKGFTNENTVKHIVRIPFIIDAIKTMLDSEEVTFDSLEMDWINRPYELKIIKTKIEKEESFSLQDGDKVKDKFERNTSLSFSQLSSGEKTLIALVADLTRRLCLANPDSDNPLEGNGIVLIDEIDVHLHPKWQRKVVTKLREIFPNIQFVVTTHSPLVLTNIKSENVRIVKDNSIYKIEDLYPDFKSYGADVEKIIQLIQGVENYIPKDIRDMFKKYFDYINAEKFDEAKSVEKELQKITDKNHPKILEGQAEIEFQQIQNEMNL